MPDGRVRCVGVGGQDMRALRYLRSFAGGWGGARLHLASRELLRLRFSDVSQIWVLLRKIQIDGFRVSNDAVCAVRVVTGEWSEFDGWRRRFCRRRP